LDICGSSIDEFVDGLLNFDRVSFRDQENPADSIIGFVGQFVNNLTFTHRAKSRKIDSKLHILHLSFTCRQAQLS